MLRKILCRSAFVVALAAASPVATAAEPLAARRAIPGDNLGYPVLLSSDTSSGSGFFINTATTTYLVTAKHVLFKDEGRSAEFHSPRINLRAYSRDPAEPRPNVASLDLPAMQAAGLIKRHATRDVVVINIGFITATLPDGNPAVETAAGTGLMIFPAGVTLLSSAPDGIVGVDVKLVRRFEDVLVGNDAIVFGFPSSLRLSPIPQLDYDRPLLQKGVIAGLNLRDKYVVINCPAYPGNSGGPVFQIEPEPFSNRFWLIGLVTHRVPYIEEWKGERNRVPIQSSTIIGATYSVVTPIDYALELLDLPNGRAPYR